MSKKQTKVITVPNPKVGKTYQFLHAGFMTKTGVLVEELKDLTKQYGYKWYKFSVKLDQQMADRMGKPEMFYPISIFDITKEEK
jgi:hypothetical protein